MQASKDGVKGGNRVVPCRHDTASTALSCCVGMVALELGPTQSMGMTRLFRGPCRAPHGPTGFPFFPHLTDGRAVPGRGRLARLTPIDGVKGGKF